MATQQEPNELSKKQAAMLMDKMDDIHQFMKNCIEQVAPGGTEDMRIRIHQHMLCHFMLQLVTFQEFTQFCADHFPEYLAGLDPFEGECSCEECGDVIPPTKEKFSGPDEKDRLKKKK